MNEPKKRSNDLERRFCQQSSMFRLRASLKTCDLQNLEMLKNASEVTLVQFFFFFPKSFELCAKFRGVQSKPG
jgi:hypothetical protein